jgi:hypothetical protein
MDAYPSSILHVSSNHPRDGLTQAGTSVNTNTVSRVRAAGVIAAVLNAATIISAGVISRLGVQDRFAPAQNIC